MFQKNVEEICEKGEIMGATLVNKKDALMNISRQFVTENEALHWSDGGLPSIWQISKRQRGWMMQSICMGPAWTQVSIKWPNSMTRGWARLTLIFVFLIMSDSVLIGFRIAWIWISLDWIVYSLAFPQAQVCMILAHIKLWQFSSNAYESC